MDARRLAVELQLSAKRGTASGEQVNAVVETLLEMADKLERLEAENAKLRELVRESLMDYRQYAEKYGLPPYLSDVNEHLDARLRELGIEASQ